MFREIRSCVSDFHELRASVIESSVLVMERTYPCTVIYHQGYTRVHDQCSSRRVCELKDVEVLVQVSAMVKFVMLYGLPP